MSGPPAARSAPDTVSRGSNQNQPRVFDEGRGVRIVGEDGTLVEVCPFARLHKYLNAPNARPKRRKDGSIRHITLLSVADDRGHLGENHGRSTVTTERVRNDWDELVGGSNNLKHKSMSSWAK